MDQDREKRLKKMRYRAWHRGTKEMDLILGTFADHELESLNPADLDTFEALLEAEDAEAQTWFMGSNPVPEALDTPIYWRVKEFKYMATAR